MELTFQIVALAFGLGLLGFIEPCTIGAHLIFLDGQLAQPSNRRLAAVVTFVLSRAFVMAMFGGAIAMIGQRFIGVQTGFWMVFGATYLLLGCLTWFGLDQRLRKGVAFAPANWKFARSPFLQGLAFGLNIPACAAPILFALTGTAAVTGSATSGAALMSTFALGLSLPLVPMMLWTRLTGLLSRIAVWMRTRRWLPASLFAVLGIWSIWFGLYVDPVDWSGS